MSFFGIRNFLSFLLKSINKQIEKIRRERDRGQTEEEECRKDGGWKEAKEMRERYSGNREKRPDIEGGDGNRAGGVLCAADCTVRAVLYVFLSRVLVEAANYNKVPAIPYHSIKQISSTSKVV
jgi:hypothetical protein